MLSMHGLGPRTALAFYSFLGFSTTALIWAFVAGDFQAKVISKPRQFLYKQVIGNRSWPGFDKVEDVILFGDSYSTTYYDPAGQRPTYESPFGNRDAVRIRSSDEGPKWIEYLQSSYNASLFKVANFAEAGATIERHAYEPKLQGSPPSRYTNSLKEEINGFRDSKNHIDRRPHTTWKSATTLFATWFGVNEVSFAVENNIHLPYEAIFATYSSSFDRLHALGARNFLIINVPPVDTVIVTNMDHKSSPQAYIKDFNIRLDQMHKKLRRRHKDATYFLFDVHSVWSRVLQAPHDFGHYTDLRNVTGWCPYYAWHSSNLTESYSDCGEARQHFFWLDNKHPTHAVQNLTAAIIAEDCFETSGRRGYCRSGSVFL